MNRLAITLLLVLGASALFPAGIGATEGPETQTEDEWTPIPFRVRDLTFPTVLVLGFMPRPNVSLDPGQWVFEFNYSASNNFQVSAGVQQYLQDRGGSRRPLDRADIDTMLLELEGEQFFFDGEFSLFDVGLHYGLTDRLVAALRVSYLSYGCGFLDDTIGIDRARRE